jgi:hypothetical protein
MTAERFYGQCTCVVWTDDNGVKQTLRDIHCVDHGNRISLKREKLRRVIAGMEEPHRSRVIRRLIEQHERRRQEEEGE